MSIFPETLTSRNQPRLDDGMLVVRLPNVIDVLDEVIWQLYVVVLCRNNKSATKNGLELLEGEEKVQVYWGSSSTGTCSLDLLLFARSLSMSELKSAR